MLDRSSHCFSQKAGEVGSDRVDAHRAKIDQTVQPISLEQEVVGANVAENDLEVKWLVGRAFETRERGGGGLSRLFKPANRQPADLIRRRGSDRGSKPGELAIDQTRQFLVPSQQAGTWPSVESRTEFVVDSGQVRKHQGEVGQTRRLIEVGLTR